MKVLFLLSLWLNSDETRVDGEIWVGKCKCIKDSWAIKFGYLMVPRGPSPMPDLGILLYEVPIKCGCFGHINYMLLFYSASQTIFFSYRICKKIHAEWGSSDLFYAEFRVPCETVKDSTEDCELCRCSRGSVAWRSIRSKLYRVWWRLFQQRVIPFDQIPSDSSLDLSLNQVFDGVWSFVFERNYWNRMGLERLG